MKNNDKNNKFKQEKEKQTLWSSHVCRKGFLYSGKQNNQKQQQQQQAQNLIISAFYIKALS